MNGSYAFVTRPLVFVGPSASPTEVQRWLPMAEVRPPVERGDLYRDRTLRYSLFVLLDGVFMQNEALPPREVIDVLNDGALVIGAASMGAIRAAECWPAGMFGVGAIYRQFRRGVLESDDEVAVVFNPEEPHPSLSVALVNVRHAVACEVATGQLSAKTGTEIVESAKALFYPDRTWNRICASVGVDEVVAGRLACHDLKRQDSVRALRVAARILAAKPEHLLRPRRSTAPFRSSEMTRERPGSTHAASLRTPDEAAGLLGWLIASGRYGKMLSDRAPAEWSTDTLVDLLAARDNGSAGEILGRSSDALEACVMRWHAVRDAAALARRNRWEASSMDLIAAERDVSQAHGFSGFGELIRALEAVPQVRQMVMDYRDLLALAKKTRERMFKSPVHVSTNEAGSQEVLQE